MDCYRNAEEDAFLNGSGVGQPLGLFAATGGGTAAISTASLTADDVIKLVYALKRPYRKNAKFIILSCCTGRSSKKTIWIV